MGVSSEKQVREFLRDCQQLPGRQPPRLPRTPSKSKKFLKIALSIIVVLVVIDWITPKHRIPQSHRAEIEAEVVDPCWLYSIRLQDTATAAGTSERQTLELMKIMSPAAVNNAITEIEKLVRGKDRKSRMSISLVSQQLFEQNQLVGVFEIR